MSDSAKEWETSRELRQIEGSIDQRGVFSMSSRGIYRRVQLWKRHALIVRLVKGSFGRRDFESLENGFLPKFERIFRFNISFIRSVNLLE